MALFRPNVSKLERKGNAPGLVAVLDDKDEQLRAAAEAALVRLGDSALPSLIGALDDGSPGTRQRASLVLGAIGNPEAIDPLVSRLESLVKGRVEAAVVDDAELAETVDGQIGGVAGALTALGDGSIVPLHRAFEELDRHIDETFRARVETGEEATAAAAAMRVHVRDVVGDRLLGMLEQDDYVTASKLLGTLGCAKTIAQVVVIAQAREDDHAESVRARFLEALKLINEA
jgi:HEAT repeat protein